MQDELISILQHLRADPSRVVALYERLASAQFLAFVRSGTEHDIALMQFLTYPASGGVRELPLFTRQNFVLALQAPGAVSISVPGDLLWPRLLEIIKTGECEAAIDPGQPHGIRLKREMVLLMVNNHATKWQYKTVASTSIEVLNTPLAEGWIVVGYTALPDGSREYLLKHKKIH